MAEFEGFASFWKQAREFWGLGDALRIFHDFSNAWAILHGAQSAKKR